MNGIQFVLDNFKKSFELCDNHPELEYLRPRIRSEYNHISKAKKTGDLYLHFLEFKNKEHEFAADFAIFNEYGIITNEELADYLEENYPDEINDYTKVEDFIVGNTYTNSDIRFGFRCTYMGGIRPSNKTNTIVIIADHVNSIYDDEWKDDILFYTGQGRIGDQRLSHKNKSLLEAKKDGRTIHLFESYREKEYIYRGEVYLCDSVQTQKQKDEKEKFRTVLIFPLKLRNQAKQTLVDRKQVEQTEEKRQKKAAKLSDEELYKRAKEARDKLRTRQTVSTYIYRDPHVSEHVKRRANGKCELCGIPAPFIAKSGEPYLEVHHVITLSNDGPDQIINAVALCPNCHRKVHYGIDNKDHDLLVKVILKNLESEPDMKEEAIRLFDSRKEVS